MSEFDFDFGFSAVDEEELDKLTGADQIVASTQDRLDLLFKSIQPLLENLKANPEKEHIFWPNRKEKIEQFQAKLLDIYTGK